MRAIQQAMVLLAYPASSSRVYNGLYDEARWDRLIEQFRQDNYRLYGLTTESLLSVTLECGMAALKTTYVVVHYYLYRSADVICRMCGREGDRNPNCPVCIENMFSLAKSLPYSHHTNSTIVCRITGRLMNEHNPPMILPNGYVYSREALEELASQDKGVVTCPRTLEQFPLSSAKKVFIM